MFRDSGYGSADRFEKRLEQIEGLLEMLRDDAGGRQHRHEVYVAVPARHHVPVHMIGEARARAASQIRAEIEAVALERGAQELDRHGLQLGERGALGSVEQFGRGEMAPRRDHEMAVVVRVAVEHYQREWPGVEHQPAAALTNAERIETEDASLPRLAGSMK